MCPSSSTSFRIVPYGIPIAAGTTLPTSRSQPLYCVSLAYRILGSRAASSISLPTPNAGIDSGSTLSVVHVAYVPSILAV